ncbi:MAG: hypothetical protein LH618_20075 [Saprospiraceae bacterium]|nr:hypothetical protein [Saprospiraceae bacterium]
MSHLSRAFRQLVFAGCLLLPAVGFGQKVFDRSISGDYRNSTLMEMFIDLEQHY